MLITSFFFFNDTATTEIYTLSLHDALPISGSLCLVTGYKARIAAFMMFWYTTTVTVLFHNYWASSEMMARSEEHTSELQSRLHLVCRLLLEKKKIKSCAPTPCD